MLRGIALEGSPPDTEVVVSWGVPGGEDSVRVAIWEQSFMSPAGEEMAAPSTFADTVHMLVTEKLDTGVY